MNIPYIHCPWCNKIYLDFDYFDIDDFGDGGWEDEVFCDHCGEQFKIFAYIDIDISTEKVIAHEPGDKIQIDRINDKTGCILQRDEECGKYLVFVDRTRTQEWIEPKRLAHAPGIWSHPDQLIIPFKLIIDNGGAICPNPV